MASYQPRTTAATGVSSLFEENTKPQFPVNPQASPTANRQPSRLVKHPLSLPRLFRCSGVAPHQPSPELCQVSLCPQNRHSPTIRNCVLCRHHSHRENGAAAQRMGRRGTRSLPITRRQHESKRLAETFAGTVSGTEKPAIPHGVQNVPLLAATDEMANGPLFAQRTSPVGGAPPTTTPIPRRPLTPIGYRPHRPCRVPCLHRAAGQACRGG